MFSLLNTGHFIRNLRRQHEFGLYFGIPARDNSTSRSYDLPILWITATIPHLFHWS